MKPRRRCRSPTSSTRVCSKPPRTVMANEISLRSQKSRCDARESRRHRRRGSPRENVTTRCRQEQSTMPDGAADIVSRYRVLGKTGERVSPIGIGGWHLGLPTVDEQLAIRIVRTAIDNGVNFLDNSWDYNEGKSEIRMGKALRDGYRQKAFLMTKVDGQTKKSAAQQLDESLKRLQTDHLDLWQFHEVIRMGDPDRIFGPGGGMEAALEAKKAGKIRYIGFTGHKSPDIHLKMLSTGFKHNFTFDTVQMPLNVMDAHFNSFVKKVLPVLLEHKIGVLGMKPMGDKLILNRHTVPTVDD